MLFLDCESYGIGYVTIKDILINFFCIKIAIYRVCIHTAVHCLDYIALHIAN